MAFLRNVRKRVKTFASKAGRRYRKIRQRVAYSAARRGFIHQDRYARIIGMKGYSKPRRRRRYNKKPNFILYAFVIGAVYLFRDPLKDLYKNITSKKL